MNNIILRKIIVLKDIYIFSSGCLLHSGAEQFKQFG